MFDLNFVIISNVSFFQSLLKLIMYTSGCTVAQWLALPPHS